LEVKSEMSVQLKIFLSLLQLLQVAFLKVHDWLPLGSLNDVRAVRAQDSLRRLVIVTLIQSLPFTVILALSAVYVGRPYPSWLVTSLWVSHSILLVGQLRCCSPLERSDRSARGR
jgi:hypothetical protein